MSSGQPKVFIDSSVLIAASISPRGSARDLVNAGIRNEVSLILSNLVITETVRNLTAKVPEALVDFDRFRETVNFEIAIPDPKVIKLAGQIIDYKDAPIVAAAVAGSANWLASYDRRHLLEFKTEIRSKFGIIVVPPDEVISHLR